MVALTITEFARMGGKARAKKLTKARRQEIAQKANEARWAKAREKLESTVDRINEGLTELKKANRANTRKRKKAANA